MSSFDQEVPFRLCDRSQHGHQELSGGAGKVGAPELQDDNSDLSGLEVHDRLQDIYGIATQSIELCHDRGLAFANLVEHPACRECPAWPSACPCRGCLNWASG